MVRDEIEVLINGEKRKVPEKRTIDNLLGDLGLSRDQVAVELNREIIKRADWGSRVIRRGDEIEIVHFVGGGEESLMSDKLKIADREFSSRLFVGTGKYETFEIMRQALEASGAEVVTVAVRRVDLSDRGAESMFAYIDTNKLMILPNTAACYSADEAIRCARLGREAGLSDIVKLEVIGDPKTLFPDNEELLIATRQLVKEGFVVLPYTSDDPIVCRKLEDAGAAAVMPLGAPIGSGLGIQNVNNIRIIVENASVPVIVDAGVGTASDAAIAMELGVDGVLMNTGIAGARDPVGMAVAMNYAVVAGRKAFLAGRIPKKMYATASSPLEGVLS